MNRFFLILLLCHATALSAQHLLSPEEFLGYSLGDRFTRHHRVVEYFQHVSSAMPNVELRTYGETYEHRPLVYAIITSPQNYAKLEQIRLDNLRRAGIEQGPTSTQVAVVWLSYNVHGNEANSMEAAMKTLHFLADPSNSKAQEWLKNTVVIIDPCINPDGRDRYANFYNQYGNAIPNPEHDAMEHHEPWPRGRANHYLFDLNRDWAWLTQIESVHRIKAYNQWLPHVHVDFHEQGFNNPYYFAPAAEPYHGVITPWQREFQVIIGKNNAKYFDAEGWLYFTKEHFDLYYPSYGDTYPTFNGSIGMTYEQAGGGAGGLTITTKEGDPLTLLDRLTHHHTAGISTVEVTALNATRLLTEFENYYRENVSNPSAKYKTYIVKADNNADRIRRLLHLLDAHGIHYGAAATPRATRGFDYSTQSLQNAAVAANDIVVSAYQPKSRFLTTLFEPDSRLSDSVTYDIVAWNLMYAYGLKGYALTERLNPGKKYEPAPATDKLVSDKPYAYLFRYNSLPDAVFLAELLRKGVKVRTAFKPFKSGGDTFDRGTLIVTRRNNETTSNFDETIKALARKHNRTIYSTATGFAESGKDLGSGYVGYLKAPKVAMLFGDQTSSLSSGEVWHFFEQELGYPITQLGVGYFESVELSKYHVLIIPEGSYKIFNEATLKSLQDWVSSGGRLIIISSALSSFADQKGFALKKYATEDEKKAAEEKEKTEARKDPLPRYDDAERKFISGYIPGAIYKLTLDETHPLAFGLGDYYALKNNDLHYGFMSEGWNVGVLKGKVNPVQGFAGYKINQRLENTISFGVQDHGSGKIIYFVDNPLFRCFWESGKMLFSNAVFLTGAE